VSSGHDLWGNRHLYELYAEAMTPWEWHAELFELARSLGVVPFSSPFDATAVALLEELQAPVYKIASLEVHDVGLLRAVAATGKPVIFSTGAASLADVGRAADVLRAAGCESIIPLVCTSSYPAPADQSDLRRMAPVEALLDAPVGLSDHSLGIGVSIAAVALGAVLLERHVTIRRSDGGPDGAFSLEPHELAQLVGEARAAYESLGSAAWSDRSAEAESRRLRRSLWVRRDVVAGEVVSADSVGALRPAGGLEPAAWDVVVGRRFTRAVSAGEPLTWDVLAGPQ
jgi:N-acetylneuraminate synthase